MLNIHNYPDITFPGNFIWGSATAAHQIEGDDIHSINWRDQTEHPERHATATVSTKRMWNC